MPALPPAIVDAGVTQKPYSWITATNTYYGYCTIADVQQEFMDVANMPSSANSKNFVAQMITDTAIELQNALELAYVMPYTGTNLAILGTLNKINRKLAAAEAIMRVFGANEPDATTWGQEQRDYAESCLVGILDGEEQWAAPFGDAQPQPEHAVYPRSALNVYSPSTLDQNGQEPIFSIGQTRINRDGLM
jgi:hypothetical protein